MDKTQIKTVICGVALVALASVPVAAQTNPCTGSGFSGGVCNRFDSTHETNRYQFGDHVIKFTVDIVTPFDLNVEFIPITDPELDARVIPPLAPVDCIKYVGATSDTNLGTCGYYHVTNPPSPSAYTGDVTVKIFWDFPTLNILNNVRLYRARLNGVPPDGTCTQGFSCYTQDITDQVFAIGDHNATPRRERKRGRVLDFEAVDKWSHVERGQGLARVEEQRQRRHPVRPEGDRQEERERGQLRHAAGRSGRQQRVQQREAAHDPLSLPTSPFAPATP